MVAQMPPRAPDFKAQRGIGERLAQFGAMLARDGEQFGLLVGSQRPGKAQMLSLARLPVAAGRGAAAQFDGYVAAIARQVARRLRQHGDSPRVIGQYPAIDGKSARHESLPEQPAFHMVQRQQPDDAARRPHCRKHQRAVASRLLDRAQPGRAMKGRRFRVAQDIILCRLRLRAIAQVERRDAQSGG